MGRRYSVGILSPLPAIPYRASFYQLLSKHPQFSVTLYFGGPFGIDNNNLGQFGDHGRFDAPDIPFLEGYNYRFLKNFSPVPNPSTAFGTINPGILNIMFRSRHDAMILYGYTQANVWLLWLSSFFSKTKLFFVGEVFLKKTAESPLKKCIVRLFFGQCCAFLSIGSKAREFFEMYHVSKEKVFHFPYAVDNERFRKGRLIGSDAIKKKKAQYQITGDGPVFLTVSRLIGRKRTRDIITAFGRLHDGSHLLVVGDGPEKQQLVDYARTNSIGNVHFLGFRNQRELSPIFSISDVFILASDFEPWGLVINEAMCFDLPVVVSEAVISANDLVKHTVNGYIFSVGDTSTMARQMEALSKDGRLRREMGIQSGNIISQWSHAQQVTGLLRACEQVLGV